MLHDTPSLCSNTRAINHLSQNETKQQKVNLISNEWDSSILLVAELQLAPVVLVTEYLIFHLTRKKAQKKGGEKKNIKQTSN